jgi:hypothetical protein
MKNEKGDKESDERRNEDLIGPTLLEISDYAVIV